MINAPVSKFIFKISLNDKWVCSTGAGAYRFYYWRVAGNIIWTCLLILRVQCAIEKQWETKQGHDKWHDVGKTTVFNQSVEFLEDLDHTDVIDRGLKEGMYHKSYQYIGRTIWKQQDLSIYEFLNMSWGHTEEELPLLDWNNHFRRKMA